MNPDGTEATPLTSLTAFIQSIQLQSVSTTGDQFYLGPATIAANGNIFSDFWHFLLTNKKWWLVPILFLLDNRTNALNILGSYPGEILRIVTGLKASG